MGINSKEQGGPSSVRRGESRMNSKNLQMGMACRQPVFDVSFIAAGRLLMGLLAFALLSSQPALATWRWANLTPHGAALHGLVWIPRNSPATAGLNGVTWANGRFVAVGDTVLTSPDGATWTDQGSRGSLADVAWMGSRLLAVGWSGNVQASPNGAVWTNQYSDLSAVASNGLVSVAVGEDGAVYTSSDGANRTRRAAGADGRLYGFAWSGTQFITADGDGGAIATSTDGAKWSRDVVAGSRADRRQQHRRELHRAGCLQPHRLDLPSDRYG